MEGLTAPVVSVAGKTAGTTTADAPAKPALDFDSPELKAAIERAVAERNAGLEKNRDKLKDELKAAKDRVKALEDSYAGVDPELYKSLLTTAEKAEQERAERERKALEEKGEYTKIIQQKDELHQAKLREYEDKVKAALDERAAIERRLHSSVAMSSLQQALVGNNVKEPALLQGAMALLRDKVTLDVENEMYVVKVDGLPIEDAVKAWAASDAGKFYTTSPASTGGGTTPSSDDKSGGRLPTHRSRMSLEQKMAYIEKHGQSAYNALPL
jgi:hypothetical protein